MTAPLRPSPAVCPACVATPAPRAGEGNAQAKLMLSVPGVHCGACITKVERALEQVEGVREARVNLTLKRAMVDAEDYVSQAALIKQLESVGYEAFELDSAELTGAQSDAEGRALLMRLAVAGFAAMNVMLLSVAVWSGATDATRDMFHWISAVITLPAIVFCGQPFYKHAWQALRHGQLNMDVPIVLAIVLAAGTSVYETAHSGAHAYFDAALALIFFLLAGRYLDHRTRAMAKSAAQELTALEVPRAVKVVGDVETVVPTSELQIGDFIRVRAGARIPIDGVIHDGTSELDSALLTGETKPIFATQGQQVSAGQINLTGPLIIRATAVGRDTTLHQLADLVAVAESGRSRYTSLADKAAKLYAPGVHILSALSFMGWFIYSGDLRVSLNIAAAVLIITCPCALGLAVPAVTTAASARLFKSGMLIKSSTAMERLSQVDTVVFDKTGTLTTGAPRLMNAPQIAPDAMAVAKALSAASMHPLARTIYAQDVAPATVRDIREVAGYGVQGTYLGQTVRMGRAEWVGAPPSDLTATHLVIGDGAPVSFKFTDDLRQGAREAIDGLRDLGKDVLLMSGDTIGAVEALAKELGITHYVAQALPADKMARIQDLQSKGHSVLMVGDGLNDTAALRAADVSISPASALDAARTASDVVLLGGDLSPLVQAVATAREATLRIKQNFRVATWYNVLAVPLAVAGLATPLIAALAMSTSSITVSLNALRLTR
ncbi:heavy metal translocating P-type ATPase [Nereida sp. MMG025]|uniref:heavy metal translocating P-type ATPase n=1 Tax=Nereida sp. MMG025 TaxID=2909981 RepID=UPI001F017263|nr:heavy metal translocating P-type ATPase [Nereida sp. MMG025]MCF6446126.1 cadmium-translocating P-type ATPase [Nereida sp. MMG025]